jgi:pyridoxamine 5'-phosphate oxidase
MNELRKEYGLKSLDLTQLNPHPFLMFASWLEEAQKIQPFEFNTMALATASTEGRPSCRMVLLKQVDLKGFLFFTNYESRKGQELAINPYACVTFYWAVLERQVIIEGKVEKLTLQESEAYFASRPRESQLAAWASHQDQVLNSQEELETAYLHFEKMYAGQPIPLPPYWGGYRLLPVSFEFWQGGRHRLHNRFRYVLLSDQTWHIDRLAP